MAYIKIGRNRAINPLISFEGKPCNKCGNTRKYNSNKRCTVCAGNWVAQAINTTVRSLRIQQIGNSCEICRDVMDKPNYDHSNLTGEFRGWLCIRCNFGLGQFRDNPDILERAVKYLKK